MRLDFYKADQLISAGLYDKAEDALKKCGAIRDQTLDGVLHGLCKLLDEKMEVSEGTRFNTPKGKRKMLEEMGK
jgi:hypothetical protein